MLKRFLVAALAALMLAGCAADDMSSTTVTTTPEAPAETPAETPAEPSVDVPAEESKGPFEVFTAVDLDGNEVTNEVFADYDLTVINVWGTFCSPCINEMPDLGQLAQEYAEKNVLFMGIVGDAFDQEGQIDDSIVADARAIVEQTGADYLHVLPQNELLYNVMSQISAFPTTIFVDSEGKQVGYAIMGANSKESWIEYIDEALALVKEQ